MLYNNILWFLFYILYQNHSFFFCNIIVFTHTVELAYIYSVSYTLLSANRQNRPLTVYLFESVRTATLSYWVGRCRATRSFGVTITRFGLVSVYVIVYTYLAYYLLVYLSSILSLKYNNVHKKGRRRYFLEDPFSRCRVLQINTRSYTYRY